jgi:hypothetical protein
MQLLLLLSLHIVIAPTAFASRQPWELKAPDPLGNVRLLADCLCRWLMAQSAARILPY